jgi:hypothetical protein
MDVVGDGWQQDLQVGLEDRDPLIRQPDAGIAEGERTEIVGLERGRVLRSP